MTLKELIEQYSYQNEGVYTLIDIENLCKEYAKICLEKAANEATCKTKVTPIKKDGSVDSKRGGTKLVTNSTVAIEKAAYSGKEVVDRLEGSTKIKTKYYGKKENKKIDIGTVGDKGLNNATGNEKLKQHVK